MLTILLVSVLMMLFAGGGLSVKHRERRGLSLEPPGAITRILGLDVFRSSD
jgi:hypothetical protein